MEYLYIMICKCMQLKLKAIPQSFFQLPRNLTFLIKHFVYVSANKLKNWFCCPDRSRSLLEVLAV